MGPDTAEALRQVLIKASVNGIPQGQITHAMRNKATASEVKTLLNKWRKSNYVQKFFVQKEEAGRPKTIWRATEKIHELSFFSNE